MGNTRSLKPNVLHLESGSNAGILLKDGHAIIIDAGLDRSAAKEILSALQEIHAQPIALIITHAHADHFGGAAALAKRAEMPVAATAFEATIIQHPIWEPIFLFAGASPIAELRHKFTLAPAAPVSRIIEPGKLLLPPFELDVIPLFGHAPAQVGIAFDDVLFCADAFFPTDTLAKHPIPFIHDMDAALDSLERLEESDYSWYAPGHGPAVEDPAGVIQANRQRLEQIREACWEALGAPQEPAAILAHVSRALGETLSDPASYALAQTTVHAALSSLQSAGRARVFVENDRLMWERAG